VATEAVCLSDLTPTEVEHVPFFDDEFPWRKDRSVSGRPLTLDGRRYEKGFGMHAQCRMVFDLRREYRRFTAVAGIDGDLRRGRASLSVTGDGKSLMERLVLDRSESAAPIALDVNGVEKLAVCVDFIEDTFGVGARVNLCDAVLAK
jgi:hypothetical protein